MLETTLFRLKLLHFSLEIPRGHLDWAIAIVAGMQHIRAVQEQPPSYYLRFPPQLKKFQAIFASSLSYAEVSLYYQATINKAATKAWKVNNVQR
jgi:hypothetical protein